MKRRNISKSIAQQGGLMIEALAMLGLIAVVTPTMYKKSAERTMEVEDINTASTIRTIMNAANDYVGANYSTIIADMGETQATRPVTPEQISDYLPYKFDVGKALYNYGNPEITIVKQGNNLTTFALFPANANIGQERTSRIASLIGASGGYVTEAGTARGIGGIWRLEGDEYTNAFPDSGAGAAEYSIVTASADTINAATGNEIDMDKYLQRGRDNTDDPNDRSTWWKNTMRTDLYMGNVDNRNDVYNNSASTDTFSIRNIKSLIVGAENATADGSADNDSEYGLYISGAGLKPNAFIQGSITAAEQAFRADATRLGFGRFVGADGANDDFHFNVDTNGNTRADGSLTNLMDVNLASKLNDAGTGPAWTDVKIGTLGEDKSLIRGEADGVGGQPGKLYVMENGYNKVKNRMPPNRPGYRPQPARPYTPAAPSYAAETPQFPIEIGANTHVNGLLSANMLDTQTLRVATLEAGSEHLDDYTKWFKANATGVTIQQINGNSTRAHFEDDKITLGVGTGGDDDNRSAGLVLQNTAGTDADGNATSSGSAQLTADETQVVGTDSVKVTGDKAQVIGKNNLTASSKATLIQALNSTDFGTGDDFTNDLSENTIKLRNSDMQATMEGKQLTIEGRDTDTTDVRTLFNKGSVDLSNADFNIGTVKSYSGSKYNGERLIFSVRANEKASSKAFQNEFLKGDTTSMDNDDNPYDIAMHGNILIGNSASGNDAIGAAGGGFSQYHVSIGKYNEKAGINIVPRSFADEENENYENIVYIDQGGNDTVNKRNDNTAPGTVYIRKGYVEVRGENYYPNYESTKGALEGKGVIVASRLVANNPANDDNGKNIYSRGATIPEFLTDDEIKKYKGENVNRYDTYMVNPAYTSVMHDIKLTTRGGARLSDILPDFINKGIYVVNNTVKETTGASWNTTNTYSGFKKLDKPEEGKIGTLDIASEASWASPFMGVVPAPQCPPGYGRVITLTPASFEVGQAGLLRQSEGRYFITPDTPSDTQADEATKNPPRFENVSVYGNVDVNNGKETVHISPGSGSKGSLTTTSYVLNYTTPSTSTDKNSATKPNAPLMFQQSTRLKSMVIDLHVNPKDKTSYAQGWAAIMGFLYPESMYKGFIDGTDGKYKKYDDVTSNYWNVFPVMRGTLEAYATVYCYFDRTNMYGGYNSNFYKFIDNYSYMKDMTNVPDSFEKDDPSNRDRLNDPELKYNDVW